jgi:hypothetical protein
MKPPKNLPNNNDVFHTAIAAHIEHAPKTQEPKWCCLCPERTSKTKAIWRIGKLGFCFGHKAEAYDRAKRRAHGGTEVDHHGA